MAHVDLARKRTIRLFDRDAFVCSPDLRRWAGVLAEKAQRPQIQSRLEELLTEYGLA